MKITGFTCALLASVVAVSANATVFYGTYTPSNTAALHTAGQSPTDQRAPDATQTFTSSANVDTSMLNCCYAYSQYPLTEFVTSTSFTASHIILPLSYGYSIANGQNIAFLLERYVVGSNSWATEGAATLHTRSLASGVQEVQLAFGTNATNLEQHFAYHPVNVLAGEQYRIRSAFSSGSVGNVAWYESDLLAAPGQTRQVGYSPYGDPSLSFDLQYQLAFALTDGGDLSVVAASGVPEPATWAMMIGGFAMAGGAMRRRAMIAAPASA